MPRIVAIHGIGQQNSSAELIHNAWWPPILAALSEADCGPFSADDLVCPFYGDLFSDPKTLSTGQMPAGTDDDAYLEALVFELWKFAAREEPENVPSPAELDLDKALTRYPGFLQTGVNALSRSKFFTGISKLLLLGDLRQVKRYLYNKTIHDRIQQHVLKYLTTDTKVVIGHSLGSVVAYEALCNSPYQVDVFITLGSPLGIKELIFEHLTPKPIKSVGAWPNTKKWINIADKGDIVALQKTLNTKFNGFIDDQMVSNGSQAHDGEKYLDAEKTGLILREVLCQKK